MEKEQSPQKKFDGIRAYLNGDAYLNGVKNVLLDFKEAFSMALDKINELQNEIEELKEELKPKKK